MPTQFWKTDPRIVGWVGGVGTTNFERITISVTSLQVANPRRHVVVDIDKNAVMYPTAY